MLLRSMTGLRFRLVRNVLLALVLMYSCRIEFDKLVRLVQRQQNISEPVPPFYIRTLVDLESSLNAAVSKEKEAKKKMNASNARALTAMKQKVKKVTKEYENDVKRFQEVRCLPADSSNYLEY